MSTRVVLYAALAVTLGLTAWLAAQPDDVPVVAPVVPRSRPAMATLASVAAMAVPPPSNKARTAWPEPAPAALAAWTAPAPPALTLVASAPTRAAAPPFPYKWIGRLEDGTTVQALLSGPQRSFGARAGEVLDGKWRVERVAGARLELTWMPTGDPVTVELR
jgi:hypothetical protein